MMKLATLATLALVTVLGFAPVHAGKGHGKRDQKQQRVERQEQKPGKQGPLKQAWMTLHQPIGTLLQTDVAHHETEDGQSALSFSANKAHVEATFPAEPKAMERKPLVNMGIEQFNLRQPQTKSGYSLQVYHEPSRLGITGVTPPQILKAFAERYKKLKENVEDVTVVAGATEAEVFGDETPTPELNDAGQYVWDVTLEVTRGQRTGQVRQRYLVTDYAIVVATARSMGQAVEENTDIAAFFDSLELSAIEDGDSEPNLGLLPIKQK